MNKKLSNLFKGDKVIWMVFFFLCIISIVEVFSASSELTYKGGNYLTPIIKHMALIVVGFGLMVVTLNINCKYFKLLTPIMLLFAGILLLLVLGLGQSTNGASRWIPIMGVQFQPSEMAKGALVLMTAQILSAMQTDKGADRKAMRYIIQMALPFLVLIGLENLSTAALLAAVIFFMMIIGRVPGKQIGKLVLTVVLLIVMVVTAVMAIGEDTEKEGQPQNLTEQTLANGQTVSTENSKGHKGVLHRLDTWKSRIDKFLNSKEVPPEKVDLDKGAQEAHAKIAIATSNIVGRGPGNSVQRDFLAQAFSDFIYAIIIEETGIEGAFVVAMLYIILLFRTGRIANRCENNYPAFLAMGLALLLVVQALFNMCVAVGLVPVTGQPLPLISKGGTSTIVNCVYIGIILSVSRTAKKVKDDTTNKRTVATATA
ncbi:MULTISPECIES: FtsW/RodA/SpoVE family cell cycle protein [Hallella]|uniref:Probable peptidoglycan glycosyltransferase FtsW n=3 Tax=Hallella TaxID=52228 RepID=A0ABV1FNY8_9BACT|nr:MULTISPECIES: FtsW/RodA/SpoVE family cell cycle protein [Hallella]MBS7400676.1 FtsW/RodA/SpoVE family cell cycle protein [Prevotella sp.]MBU0289389.1 FtsW/RodA/SpoVE family cell cycle protein [Hallella faecis]MCI7434144.1 FtsW/RodA/SpoVE family cell cycle protein [Prevotella sp.]MDD7144609.1 FtsW/RodA/SpoVE family cell cycle protein [Hallella sp.]MDR4001258.1 FtsW/RodA/SpoVE family cell cycle protein [Hallella sp.]